MIPDTNLMILYPDNLILNRNNNFPDIQYFDDQLRQKNYQRSMLYFKYNNIKHQFTKDQEAIEFILNEIKPIFYGYANAHYELNKQIDNFNLTNGLRLYFIEYGEKANWMNGIYNKLSILIAFPDGKYLIWEGYTDYDGGMGILKQILSTLKQIN